MSGERAEEQLRGPAPDEIKYEVDRSGGMLGPELFLQLFRRLREVDGGVRAEAGQFSQRSGVAAGCGDAARTGMPGQLYGDPPGHAGRAEDQHVLARLETVAAQRHEAGKGRTRPT